MRKNLGLPFFSMCLCTEQRPWFGWVGFGVGTISCHWERRADSCAHGGEIHIGAAMCSSSHESFFLFIYRPPRSHRSDSCHHGNRPDTTATVCSPHAGHHTPLEEFCNSGYGKTPSHVVSLWMSSPEMMTTCSTSPYRSRCKLNHCLK